MSTSRGCPTKEAVAMVADAGRALGKPSPPEDTSFALPIRSSTEPRTALACQFCCTPLPTAPSSSTLCFGTGAFRNEGISFDTTGCGVFRSAVGNWAWNGWIVNERSSGLRIVRRELESRERDSGTLRNCESPFASNSCCGIRHCDRRRVSLVMRGLNAFAFDR